jgi:hypothetical protein
VTEHERADLRKQLEEKYNWYKRGSHLWSAAHHGSLYVAAILSAGAALVLKLSILQDWTLREDVSAAAAAAAALLGTLAASGGFDLQWRANRISRDKIDELRIDLTDDATSLHDIRTRLKAVVDAHARAIVGDHN